MLNRRAGQDTSLSELGSLLRRTREEQGLRLEDVEAQTRMRTALLRALEEGDLSPFASKAQARLFCAAYARFLGLDEAPLLALLRAQHGTPTQEVPRPTIAGRLAVPLLSRRRRRMPSLLLVAALGLLTIAVLSRFGLLSALFAWLPSAPPEPAGSLPPAARPIALQEPPTPTSAALPLPTPAPTPTFTPHIALRPTATPFQGLVLRVRITSTAWLRVLTDGEVAFEGTLQPGEERAWQASSALLLRTGNAGGTEASINGQALGPLGKPGQVLEREWRWEGGKAVEVKG
jgi:cytoskeleton protein RodZ